LGLTAKASRENNLSNYGAGILAAGKALGRRISKVICNERATPLAAKRTSQSAQVFFFAMPKPTFRTFVLEFLVLVSDFDIRISDFGFQAKVGC
jgi:hypothetical protein